MNNSISTRGPLLLTFIWTQVDATCVLKLESWNRKYLVMRSPLRRDDVTTRAGHHLLLLCRVHHSHLKKLMIILVSFIYKFIKTVLQWMLKPNSCAAQQCDRLIKKNITNLLDVPLHHSWMTRMPYSSLMLLQHLSPGLHDNHWTCDRALLGHHSWHVARWDSNSGVISTVVRVLSWGNVGSVQLLSGPRTCAEGLISKVL